MTDVTRFSAEQRRGEGSILRPYKILKYSAGAAHTLKCGMRLKIH
jgi:hypothetical protein